MARPPSPGEGELAMQAQLAPPGSRMTDKRPTHQAPRPESARRARTAEAAAGTSARGIARACGRRAGCQRRAPLRAPASLAWALARSAPPRSSASPRHPPLLAGAMGGRCVDGRAPCMLPTRTCAHNICLRQLRFHTSPDCRRSAGTGREANRTVHPTGPRMRGSQAGTPGVARRRCCRGSTSERLSLIHI